MVDWNKYFMAYVYQSVSKENYKDCHPTKYAILFIMLDNEESMQRKCGRGY